MALMSTKPLESACNTAGAGDHALNPCFVPEKLFWSLIKWIPYSQEIFIYIIKTLCYCWSWPAVSSWEQNHRSPSAEQGRREGQNSERMPVGMEVSCQNCNSVISRLNQNSRKAWGQGREASLVAWGEAQRQHLHAPPLPPCSSHLTSNAVNRGRSCKCDNTHSIWSCRCSTLQNRLCSSIVSSRRWGPLKCNRLWFCSLWDQGEWWPPEGRATVNCRYWNFGWKATLHNLC